MDAVLPDARSARKPATGRRRNFTREQRIADGAVCGSVVVASVSYALEMAADAGYGVSVRLVLALLLTVHVLPLPLLWRRQAPWAALAVIGATALAWPVLLASGALPPSTANCLLGGGLIEPAAVYGVAAYGRVLKPATVPVLPYVQQPSTTRMTYPSGYRLSYLSVPAMVLSFGVSMTAAFTGDGMLFGEPAGPLLVLFLLAEVLLWLGLVLTAAWWAGWLMHRRRRRVLGREDAAFAGLLSSTKDVVHSERQRVAGGLQETVLQQTTLVIASAEAGSLNDVAAATRATLAAMRQLLGSLDAGKAPAAPGKVRSSAPRSDFAEGRSEPAAAPAYRSRSRWPTVPGRSAGVFLHVNGDGAAAGCVSVPRLTMDGIVGRVAPAAPRPSPSADDAPGLRCDVSGGWGAEHEGTPLFGGEGRRCCRGDNADPRHSRPTVRSVH